MNTTTRRAVSITSRVQALMGKVYEFRAGATRARKDLATQREENRELKTKIEQV